MLKLLLILSMCVYAECNLPRNEYSELLDTVLNRLRLFKRDQYPRETKYESYERYNRYDDKDSNYIDDIRRRERIRSRYKDHHSRSYHNQKKLFKLVDDTENHVEKESKNEKDHKEIRLQMPNIQPKETDTYMCYGYKLPTEDSYLVKFTPIANQKVAHHMLLFGCEEPYRKKEPWTCREMQPVCKTGMQRIMYAWAKNAPPLEMPKNVGIHVGGQSGVNYLVVQVHYLDISSFKKGHVDSSGVKATLSYLKPHYFAGIYILADGYHSIPAHKKKIHIDMGCSYNGDNYYSNGLPTIYPFRFRVHTHKLGTVVTGYRVRDGKWTLIGKGDPQKPQAFYKVFNDVDVKDGDKLYGRCTFNSTKRNNTTHIGATHSDEMCNFYIMYFYNSNAYHPAMLPCGYLDADSASSKFPDGSDTPLIQTTDQSVSRSKVQINLPQLYHEFQHWPIHGNETGRLPFPVGQISGVAIDPTRNELVLFHRGERVWNGDTFLNDNIKNRTLIPQSTLVWINESTGKVTKSGGARMFSLPHGVSVDKYGNIWVTDVGAHQVFKLSPDLEVLKSFGRRFKKGNDHEHFCKPTDVAIMDDGSFFVSDGYCNQRVLKFNKDGEVVMIIEASSYKNTYNFPKPYTMNVVHSLALDEKNDRLFVADRENQRVLVFSASSGEFRSHIPKGTFDGAVYAIAYNKERGGLLHVVNGPVYGEHYNISGFTYSLKLKKVASKWRPSEGFSRPHDIAVTRDDRNIFVATIGPNKIWNMASSMGKPIVSYSTRP